jgi:uncharacterized protein (DUF1501 family)
MPTRRDFLRSSSLIALAPTVPAFLARLARGATAEADGRVLVVIQLEGGNDGINTVVPFASDAYGRSRKELRLEAGEVLRLDDSVGLHPQMRGAMDLLDSGRLAIVPGVGYPNPNRSHFESLAIWQTARLDPEERGGPGWIGRGLDDAPGGSSLFVGGGAVPPALRGRRSAASSLERLDDLLPDPEIAAARTLAGDAPEGDGLGDFLRRATLDAYASADRLSALAAAPDDARYPETPLAGRLRTVARLIRGGFGARVYYTSQGGYDTHAGQRFAHAGLLAELSGALRSFLDDLAAATLADRVVVLAFSEFGRRVAENASAGTDHGTAAPVFLAGPSVRAGLIGAYPSLDDLDDEGDLKMSVDFRRVYAALLDGWLGLAPEPALGGRFEPLAILR